MKTICNKKGRYSNSMGWQIEDIWVSLLWESHHSISSLSWHHIGWQYCRILFEGIMLSVVVDHKPYHNSKPCMGQIFLAFLPSSWRKSALSSLWKGWEKDESPQGSSQQIVGGYHSFFTVCSLCIDLTPGVATGPNWS